jgi:hypothetical protein
MFSSRVTLEGVLSLGVKQQQQQPLRINVASRAAIAHQSLFSMYFLYLQKPVY